MQPVIKTDKYELWRGDCREILPLLNPVELLLADPPYDVQMGGAGAFGKREVFLNTEGFTDGGCDYSFLDTFDNWFSFCSLKQLPELLQKARAMPRHNLITWCKPNPVPTCNNKYLPDVEYVVHGFGKGRLFGDYGVKSSFEVAPVNKVTGHPNEKPLGLITRLMELGSNEGETVLDPFMGSGTTGIACIKNGRYFIGIERDEKWFNVAAQRLADCASQGMLEF